MPMLHYEPSERIRLMKKIISLSVLFLGCVAIGGFGAWKFELHKKFSNFRMPASEITTTAEESETSEELTLDPEGLEEEASTEKNEKNEGQSSAGSEMKIELVKVEEERKEDSSNWLKKANTKPKKMAETKKSIKATGSKVKAEDSAKGASSLVLSKGTVKHLVSKDETAWFLASVYYGQGQRFEDILKANGFKDANEIREGKEILIPSPQYHKGQNDFARRYADTWEKREAALKEKNKSLSGQELMQKSPLVKDPMPSAKVIIPIKKIRTVKETADQILRNSNNQTE